MLASLRSALYAQALSELSRSPLCGFHRILAVQMVRPLTVGPMAITGFAWNQGEANSGSPVYYTCAQPALVSSWRDAFRNPAAYFGFVMIGGSAPWAMRDTHRVTHM
jgi:hypothetical protein